MPLVISNIKTDWDNAKLAGALFAMGGLAYGNGKDNGGTLIILEFTYGGESFHLTMPLASGGVTSSFHVTADNPKTGQLDPKKKGQKSGTTYTVKNKPSAYYDFRIASSPPHTVTFTAAEWVEISGEKMMKVNSAPFLGTFITAVHAIVRSLIVYMLAQGTEHATTG